MPTDGSHSARGYSSILAGYIGWGLFPLYWQLLVSVSPLEVTLHRIIWSVPVLALLIHLTKRRQVEFSESIRSLKQLKLLLLTSVLITLNWGIYVWAVTNERVVEASMGYFLSPLIHIAAGVWIFKEKLASLQKISILAAALGVTYYVISQGTLPWVALGVGFSFASYGVLRKKIKTGALVGLYIETLIMAPVALAWVAWLTVQHRASFLQSGSMIDLWLVVGGIVTVAPLALFTTGARILPMTTVGILFFITPSMQFLTGTLVLHEPLNAQKLTAFAIIWLGIIIYTVSLMRGIKPTSSRR